MIRVLFVCMGNICRSPTAQGVFEAIIHRERLARKIQVDSAGTHAYHVGEPPDERAMDAARKRNLDLSRQRARRVSPADFEEFDYVLAMDRSNHEDLRAICPQDLEQRLLLLLDFAPHLGRADVPDPYYGGPSGFERVLDMLEAAAEGLLAELRTRHNL